MPCVRSGAKPLAATLALVLVTGLVACGGGDATSSGTSTAATTPSSGAEDRKGGEASIEEFGSEAGRSDREAILAAFTDYMNAIAGKDYAAACSHLSATVQSSLQQFAAKAPKGTGCAAILPALLAPTAAQLAREQANGHVTRVRVEGDRAFVVFHAPGAKLYQLTMVREGGKWKASTVAAAVLVPDL
jgi:hypothetical protein